MGLLGQFLKRSAVFFLPLARAKNNAEGGAMDIIWEKYRGFATTSLDMVQDSSSLKDIATVLDIAQFWLQLTEGASREMGAETRRAAR